MNKQLISKDRNKIIIAFFIIFFYIALLNFFFDLFKINKPEYTYNTRDLSFISILLTLSFAFTEELIFRFFLTLTGWFSAIMSILLVFISIITINPYLDRNNIYYFIICYFSFSLIGLYIISFYKYSRIYKILYTPSIIRNIISIFTFCVVHIANYNYIQFNLNVIIYVLLLYLPYAIFFSHIRINYKYGFWIATGFHFFNNILATILSIYLK
jgi:hypothetical protein